MSERSRSRSRGRSAGGTGQPASFPAGRATEFPLRILVSSEMVGAIIGRGGATIRGITQGTRARVDVHRKENVGSVEKAITIYGNPENCSSACKKILEVMSQEAINTNKGEISLKILAHNSLIGRIIGKGGATIKKIMQDTDTKINVSSVNEVSGLNIERVISIRGGVEGMAAAESFISSKLRTSYENDLQALAPGVGGMFPGLHPMAMMSTMAPPRPQQISSYGTAVPPTAATPPYPLLAAPCGQQQVIENRWRGEVQTNGERIIGNLLSAQETVQMYIPNNSVGAVIGTKGSHIRNIIRFSGASVKIATVSADKNEQPTERQVTIVGTPEAQWKAQCMIFEKIREEGFGAPNEEPRLSVEISVPSGQVGRIIGKGGTNVRELQRLTGAVIKFPSAASESTGNANSTPVSESTSVHINGSFYSVQSAQRRIRAMLSPRSQ